MRRRRGSITLLIPLLPIPAATTIVITIIHLQLPAHQLVVVEVADCCCSVVDVGVFEEAEAFGFAGFFVVDEAEVYDGADALEEVADLLFADAVGDIPDEDDAAAFFSRLGHVGWWCWCSVGLAVDV